MKKMYRVFKNYEHFPTIPELGELCLAKARHHLHTSGQRALRCISNLNDQNTLCGLRAISFFTI